MLTDVQVLLSAIVMEVGLADQSHFTKAFKHVSVCVGVDVTYKYRCSSKQRDRHCLI